MTDHRAVRLLAILLVAAAPLASAADVARGPEGIPAVAAIASPLAPTADLGARLQTALSPVSLRGYKELAPEIGKLTAAYAAQGAPEQRLILAALGQPAAAVEKSLAAAGIPEAAAKRVAEVAAKAQANASKDPALAQALEAAAKAAASPSVSSPAAAKIQALVDSVVSGWTKAVASAPAAPLGKIGSITFGQATLPRIALPSQGDIISDLWKQAHAQGPALLQANYNFDDMDIAQDIIAKAKAGQKQVLVGDYSNWFPERMPQAKHGGKTTPRTEAMNLIVDYLKNGGQNLDFYILKGLGDIGINHNKFSLFTSPAGTIIQSGSFNYTKTSQLNHWENVTFSDDQERVKYYQTYFQWLTRRARRFNEDLQPEDPKFDPADPIPQPPAEGVSLHGVPFPKVSYSPNGGTEDWLVKMMTLAQKSIHILMFSPFPTPKMSAAIEDAMKRGVEVIMVADQGQVANATPIVPLVQAGMQMYTIHGPDVVVQHQPFGEHSKQHEKVIIVDGRMVDERGNDLGLAKMGDSLNISKNALEHNFENTQFFDGPYVAFMQAHFDYVRGLATAITQEALQTLAEKNAAHMAANGQHAPWAGEQPQKAGAQPAGAPQA